MCLYRAVITPQGPLASPLYSDTLFGAFCWAWLRLYGQAALEQELIDPCLNGAPPAVFSNGFPQGTLPLPLGTQDAVMDLGALPTKAERRRAYQNNKRLKGAKYIDRAMFLRLCRGEAPSAAQLTGALYGEPGEAQTTLRNLTDRETDRVAAGARGGQLFIEERRFFAPGQRFDVYLLSPLPQKRLRAALDLMFTLGIGGGKSTGSGVFRLEELAPDSALLASPAQCNAFVTLSNLLPAQTDPTAGRYQLLPKYGRLDRELAASETPFKKPLLFVQAGAVFYTAAPRPWYGRCVTDVAAAPVRVTVNGCSIAVPACLPADDG